MIYKPHSVTIRAESRDGAGGTSLGASRSIKCQITPMTQSKAFESYGISLSRPHQLLADKIEADYLPIGAAVAWGARRFKVSTSPAIFDFGNAADHCQVAIEEVDQADYNA